MIIAGADEAGRGSLAGPVVGVAIILPKDYDISKLKDSKKMTPKARGAVYKELRQLAMEGLGSGQLSVLGAPEIDRVGIQEANKAVLSNAMMLLTPRPDKIIVDGLMKLHIDEEEYDVEYMAHADALVPVVSAASIIAKVYRDMLMENYAEVYPGYGFEFHKGYYCKQHIDAIKEHGRCPIHRRSFKVKALGEK